MQQNIYIVQELYKEKTVGFSYFPNKDEAKKYITELLPVLADHQDLDDTPPTVYKLYTIEEDTENLVTCDNIRRVENNGRIIYYNECDDDGNYYTQPEFVQDAFVGGRQKYNQFYYKSEDGKYVDYMESFDTLEEIAQQYYYLQDL